jgi:2'-deoxynucleoside 5'-phosphate N-hydrolase
MQIYFCGSILGGRGDVATYRHIVSRLQSEGHIVSTHHVAQADVLEQESTLPAGAVFERDAAWLRQADLMIAEVSTPSLGVGYEIACGLQRGIPVLCLYRQGLQISKMITGNSAPNLQVRSYRDLTEVDEYVARFLSAAR